MKLQKLWFLFTAQLDAGAHVCLHLGYYFFCPLGARNGLIYRGCPYHIRELDILQYQPHSEFGKKISTDIESMKMGT